MNILIGIAATAFIIGMVWVLDHWVRGRERKIKGAIIEILGETIDEIEEKRLIGMIHMDMDMDMQAVWVIFHDLEHEQIIQRREVEGIRFWRYNRDQG